MARGMEHIVNIANERIDESVRTLTTNIFGSVIKETAVLTGHAKHNWQCTLDSAATEERDGYDSSGASTLAEMEAVVPAKAGSVVYLANNVPYIGLLEYGVNGDNNPPWSKKAPNGMVRISIQRFVK